MPSSVAHADRQTRLNSVRPQMAKAQTPSNLTDLTGDPEDDAEVLSLIQTAIRKAGLKLDYLASKCNPPTTKGQLSGALNGHSGFNVRWLWKWPEDFWAEFLPLVRAAKEQSAEADLRRRVELLKQAIDQLVELAHPKELAS